MINIAKIRHRIPMETRKRFSYFLLKLTLIAACGLTAESALAQQRIERGQLEAMFTDMRAKAPWNVDGPLLWGYFFFDASAEKLEKAAAELASKGYEVVGIASVRSGLYRLHVQQIETHTPASLDSRNQEFYALADRLQINSYDGMDVGPAGPRAKR